MSSVRIATVVVLISLIGGMAAAQNETKIGAWRYLETHSTGSTAVGYRALAVSAANKNASFGFACDEPGPVSIYAVVIPGEALGLSTANAAKRALTFQVDNRPSVTKDWFYPDESKGENFVSMGNGIDTFDVLNAVRKGQKTVKVKVAKAGGKTLEFTFDISGTDAALAKLIADCKSADYK
ncbi:MAG: hypothetical protein ABI439_13260 [Rhodospirillales bacterium]